MTTNPPAVGPDEITLDPRIARRRAAMVNVFGEEYADRFTAPYIVLNDQPLESEPAARFYKRDFGYVSKQLYAEYQYRSWKGFNMEVLEKYAEVTTTKLANIKVLMQSWIARLAKVLEQNGKAGDELSLFGGTSKVDAPIIATHARGYLEVLFLLDRVHTLAGSANLWGLIDSKQRAEAEWLCKKAVRAFRSIVQQEVLKVYREAKRLQLEHQTGGTMSPEMNRVVEQQGKDIEAMAQTSKEDDAQDGGIGNVDPGKLIDDATAASIAAAGAGARKRTAKPKGEGEASSAPAGDAQPVAAAA